MPCCDWIGEDGSGHFVKMVHNGIEYGDMQLICEAYQIMKDVLKMSNDEMHEVFKKWNEGELSSYLIEITADILKYKEKDGTYLVDNILDTAGEKGTGKWTAAVALELGSSLTLIGEAVFARYLSFHLIVLVWKHWSIVHHGRQQIDLNKFGLLRQNKIKIKASPKDFFLDEICSIS